MFRAVRSNLQSGCRKTEGSCDVSVNTDGSRAANECHNQKCCSELNMTQGIVTFREATVLQLVWKLTFYLMNRLSF